MNVNIKRGTQNVYRHSSIVFILKKKKNQWIAVEIIWKSLEERGINSPNHLKVVLYAIYLYFSF